MSKHNREPHTAHAAHRSPTPTRQGPTEKPTPVVLSVSDDDRACTIRVRAYGLWERAGRPDGDAAQQRFWFEAEKDLAAARALS